MRTGVCALGYLGVCAKCYFGVCALGNFAWLFWASLQGMCGNISGMCGAVYAEVCAPSELEMSGIRNECSVYIYICIYLYSYIYVSYICVFYMIYTIYYMYRALNSNSAHF